MRPEVLHYPDTCIGFIHSFGADASPPPEGHRHRELEFNLITAGSGTCLVAGQRLVLRPGTLLWLFPDQEHHLIETERGFSMLVAALQAEPLVPFCRQQANRTLLTGDPGQALCRSLDSPTGRDLASHVHEVQKRVDEPDFFNAHLVALFLRAWHVFCEEGSPVTTDRVHPGVSRAAHLLNQYPDWESLPALAERCGLSYSRLARLFPEVFGCTLVAYRNRLRVDRFKALFTARKVSLTEAALEAGFGSYPQFHKVFRHIEGLSPAQWRRGVRSR
ncbi:MAG: helix-turn-helix domain-containing protein [Opitutales bacterium]